MSPFTVGDRVKVDELTGDITEMSLLVTRLRTIKNEDVTIPNTHILAGETINYSSSAKSTKKLIVPLSITIGYEVSKDLVKNLLLKSTANIENVLEEPQAFVLLTSLDNSYISYELNVFTEKANNILQIKSDLMEKILEEFNKSEIEILSPQYISMRESNESTVIKEGAK